MNFKNISLLIVVLALSKPALGMFGSCKKKTNTTMAQTAETKKVTEKLTPALRFEKCKKRCKRLAKYDRTDDKKVETATTTRSKNPREEAARLSASVETIFINNIVENVHAVDSKKLTACTLCKKQLEDKQTIAIAQPCGHVLGHLECARLHITMNEDRFNSVQQCSECKTALDSYGLYKITSTENTLPSPDFKKPACRFDFRKPSRGSFITKQGVIFVASFAAWVCLRYYLDQNYLNPHPEKTAESGHYSETVVAIGCNMFNIAKFCATRCVSGLHYCASYLPSSCSQNSMVNTTKNPLNYGYWF